MSIRFIIGKARSGKTALVISEIREAVGQGSARALLLVPEQYSHEAERELCDACGDRLSLYAEVMSFSGFARWSMGRHGGAARARMDEGGKLLCMGAALRELQPVLRIFGKAADNPDLQILLLDEVKRLQAASCDSGELRRLADELDGELSGKCRELALILETFKTEVEASGASAEETLELLAGHLKQFALPEFDRVYVDGFIDFTGLEMKVLRALLQIGTDVTVCLPAVDRYRREEYLLPSQTAFETLKELAESIETDITVVSAEDGDRTAPLPYFADHMFDYAAEKAEAEKNVIRLVRAANPRVECEAAAAEILHAVREEGYRWRDLAVAVRGFEDYRSVLESTCRRYGIPLFVTRRDSIAEKPLPLWMETAYDVILSGWDPDDVAAHLQCGLSGLEENACDELCRYLYKWKLRAGAWRQAEPWRQHPDGYDKSWTEDASARLKTINETRRKVSGPLQRLSDRAAEAHTARTHAEAMCAFLRETRVAEILEARAAQLERDGEQERAAEYVQIWNLCCDAIRQISSVLGDTPMDTASFCDVLHAVLSRYDTGLIPVALDRVSAGDFDRMRRRNIRCLIVLGTTDDRLPTGRSGGGVFNAEERDILAEHKLMAGGGEVELWREYALIYHTLTLPHERLILSCPATGWKGETLAPAMVYSQARRIFSIEPEEAKLPALRLNAKQPALSLAVSAARPGAGAEAQAAAAWFRREQPERLEALLSAARISRADLSPRAVEALYGSRIRISPSRLERFSACRFAYYCNYGLKAEPEEPAAFQAPEIGTFIHAVLEQTAREVSGRGGFAAVSDAELREITRTAISDYIHLELNDFQEKTARFRYLFERVCSDVYQIVSDTAEELRRSDFVPLSFELDVSRLAGETRAEENSLQLTGITDRVDGWISGDSLWLRVVDYKTGKKKFSLSDVCYGRNMQMLLYLFAVCEHAEALYGRAAQPAGILYLPAREELLHFDRAPEGEEAEKQRRKGKRRSGLVLDDPALIEAWERGEDRQYIPVKLPSSNPLVNLEQMGQLRRHVERSLQEMSEEILRGSISVRPAYVSESDNACRLCQYHSICRFEEGENGDSSRVTPRLKDEEVWEKLGEEEP